ncbi:JmjC domain-containing protein 4 [Aphelenchoides besseyi]|nr:JmjC domain-containing protein 4 [Aphelenchoides besseyi]
MATSQQTDEPWQSDYPPRVPANRMSTAEFIHNYLLPNKPVIITGATKSWKAMERFLRDDGTPNFDSLLKEFGHLDVPVTICSTGKTKKMNFADFIRKFQTDPSTDYYVRDWHLFSDTNDYSWYLIPRFFSNDWVNLRECVRKENLFEKGYRFMYMGGHGTYTGFHADVFNSYSWSANICGLKKWYMLPEGTEKQLDGYETETIDLRENPEFIKAGGFVFWQFPGDLIFVPSGYYHQVHNQHFTISINHNWINSFNLHRVLDLMFNRLEAAKKEVKLLGNEISDPVELVEHFLYLDYGMNLDRAIKLCNCISNEEPTETTVAYISDLIDKCTCLEIEGDFRVCSHCQSFTTRHDREVSRECSTKLKAEIEELRKLKWLENKRL